MVADRRVLYPRADFRHAPGHKESDETQQGEEAEGDLGAEECERSVHCARHE